MGPNLMGRLSMMRRPMGAAMSGAMGRLPLARTPHEALRLPSGTHFRTPGGRIKLRP